MAESYRGLTIRIGGDTTKLSAALKTANKAVAGTQTELRKLSQALKMDPSSLKASQLQMGAMAEQASNVAARVIKLNGALKQVGESIPRGASETVKEMAGDWHDVQANAARALDRYDHMTKALATNYTEMTNLHKEAAKLAGTSISKKLSESVKDMNFDKAAESIKNLRDAFGDKDGKLKETLKQLGKLSTEYAKLSEEAAKYKQTMEDNKEGGKWVETEINGVKGYAHEMNESFTEASIKLQETSKRMDELRNSYAKVISELSKYKGEGIVFSNKNGNVDLASIAKALKQIVDQEQMSAEKADEMYDHIENMKNAWMDAEEKLSAANKVAAFADLEAEAAKAEAQMEQLIAKLVDAAKVTPTIQALGKLNDKLREISKSGSEAKTRLTEALDAISNNNKMGKDSGTALLNDSIRSYSDLVADARAKVANLQEQISMFTDDEIKTLAASTRSFADDIARTKDNYENAERSVQAYDGMLKDLKDEMLQLEKQDENFKDNERWQTLAQQAQLLGEGLDRAKEAAGEAKKEFQKFTDADYLRNLYHEEAMAVEKAEELANINIKPEVDVSAVEGLKKSMEAISKGLFDNFTIGKDGKVEFLSEIIREVEVADGAIKSAKKNFEAFYAAAKADPKNEQKRQQAAEALDNLYAKLKAKREALNKVIEATPKDKIDEGAIANGTVEEEYQKAKKSVDELNKKLEALERKKESLQKQKGELKIVSGKDLKESEDLKKRIEELDKEINKLKQDSTGVLDRMNTMENTKRIEDAKREVVELGNAAQEAGDKFDKIYEVKAPKIDQAAFMQSVNMMAQAARRAASEIISSSNEIDSAYRDMRKTVNGTEQQFERLREAAIEYSQTHFTSADTMLEMQSLGGQLGILIDDLGKFGTIASNLDISTDIGAEDIALQLGQMANVMQLDIDGMQGFSDALVRLGNNMPAQESRIMNVAQRFAAVATTANFSADEILAWSASIASTGQRSEAAATAIGNTVSGIEQAIANGGVDLKQFAAIASMSSQEFVKAWQDDPTQALKAFIQGLNDLKESDESAVAALENMGITGVRQQQTLLGLSQTIGSLDNALLMSKDAWNGVTDQWGQAGDAAIEAQKKSEGFSGALAMLKNNIQNLGAAFGDGFVPVMKAASSVIAMVTDMLNAMPAPLKTLVVGVGAASVAFGAIAPVVTTFSGGITKMMEAARNASSLGQFVTMLTNVKGAAEGAEVATASLGLSFNPTVLAISAAVVALGALWAAYKDYEQQQKNIQEATIGLTTSMDGLNEAYGEYNENAKNTTTTISELKDEILELTEAQADLAQKLREDWEEVGTEEAMVDALVEKIGELAKNAKLTADSQAELIATVETFNTMTGNSVQILDQEMGMLSETTGAIEAMADAWKRGTESDTALEHYNELLERRAELTSAIAEREAKLGDQQQEQVGWFVDMRDGVNETSLAYSGLSAQLESARADLDSVNVQLENERSKLLGLNRGLSAVNEELANYGKSISDYGDFTSQELGIIVAAFNDTSDSSVSALKRIENAIRGIKDARNDAASAANKAIADAEKEYKRMKKQLDNEYKERKRILDAGVKDLQRSLDAEYKAKQREYDRSYKAAQKAYDAEYKAAQKAYDSQYKAAQKAYDAQYKQAQKAFDAEYKEYQKMLDAEYKALQKSLDSEYNARKKEYDNALKLLKKQQGDEVDAFKKATDAKLKEMEREYKEKLRLLELEYGQQDNGLEDEIKKLKAETEAEKKAIEERNQNDKVAELQKAVEQAKSRRTRAEAEKALSDYLQEIEQKRNEDSREAEIERIKERQEAVKEELDQRKEALKEEYDAEVEAYKAKREAELAALQEANDVEYEAKKEYYDLQLEQLKEAQTAQLEAAKEIQTEQLEQLKESQSAQLESLKEAQSEQLEALKESQSAQLEALKESQQESLDAMKQSQQDELDALKQSHQDQLDAQKQKNQEELDALKEKNEKKLEKVKNGNEDIEEEEKKSGEKRVEQTKRTNDEQLMHIEMFKRSMRDEAEETGEEYNSGLSVGFEHAIGTCKTASEDMAEALTNVDTYDSGWDMMLNFANGIIDSFNESAYPGLWSIAEWIASIFEHSTPKKGPLKGDDKWFVHLGQNLIDGLKSKEGELYKQVDKMARTMEEGFDPNLTVDAALDAVSAISKGRKADALALANESKSMSVEVNVNLSDVSIRSDADIEKLATEISQRMAAQVRRQQAGRL